MRILHVIPAYWPFLGGAQTYLKAISERLVAEGHQVTVVTTDAVRVEDFWSPGRNSRKRGREAIAGVVVERLPVAYLPPAPYAFALLRRLTLTLARFPGSRGSLFRLGGFFPWVPTLEATLEALPEPFDLVHGVDVSFESLFLAGWRYAQRRRLPFVATPLVHTGEAGKRDVVRHYTMPHQLDMLRRSTAVLVQTERERETSAALGVERERLHRIGMGIDPGQTQGGNSERFRRHHGLRGRILAFLGGVTYDKGAYHLVAAAQCLWEQGDSLNLVLAGPVAEDFRHRFRTFPSVVRDRVHLLGPVTEEEKQDLLAACHLLAMPSRVDTFGIVYLEAWAYGKPVIGALAGGVPEVITHGVDGLLVPFGDVPSLAEALQRLLHDESLAQTLGQAGYEKMLRNYTWETIYRKVKAVYADCLCGA